MIKHVDHSDLVDMSENVTTHCLELKWLRKAKR